MSRKTIGIISVAIVAFVVVGFFVANDFLGLLGEEVEPDASRILFDEYVQTFSEILQYEFDVFLDDGVISQDEVNQINFLKQFTQTEQIEFIHSGKHSDFDWDKDNMNNYFEKTIADLPYDVYNGRYAIIIDTDENTVAGDSAYYFLTDEQKFDSKKVVKLTYKKATIDDFQRAVTEFSSSIEKNSFFYLMFESHGSTTGVWFNDGTGYDTNATCYVHYDELGEILDQIHAKTTAITLYCCGQAGSINSLKITSSPYVLVTMPLAYVYGTSDVYDNPYTRTYSYIASKDYDFNGNGFVSLGESYGALRYSMTPFWNVNPPEEEAKYGFFESEGGLTSKVYFGDFSVVNQKNLD
ncbi:MAG: hypothetical protein CW691_05225 [Candidatus Bathyarchaeum sp.]|nr:MAG: hypothetical protein CW691_05225 [Candidatus Bathyarchaeum sp.]